uniref:CD83 molecule n=1 Tax=Amazona collaria TaxID=241587 RepID=A0A8B9F291_9PSIT
ESEGVKAIFCSLMAGEGEEIAWKVLDVESQYPKELGRSLGLSNDTFSLRIKNATSQNSGTYKCTLGEQRGENSLSSTVTLKVTGCAGIEDEKLKKHRAELFMLTCLGIFYLLLIFFTCVSYYLSYKQHFKFLGKEHLGILSIPLMLAGSFGKGEKRRYSRSLLHRSKTLLCLQ